MKFEIAMESMASPRLSFSESSAGMKKVVWALFDSGNGCYKRSADEIEEIEIYSIGLDIENKNSHFINLNLADYSRLFGNNQLFETLDKLPHPDLIIASPPCESWSV